MPGSNPVPSSGHIGLNVTDLDRSEAFCRRVLHPDGIRLEVVPATGLAGVADAPRVDPPTCGSF